MIGRWNLERWVVLSPPVRDLFYFIFLRGGEGREVYFVFVFVLDFFENGRLGPRGAEL